MSAATAFVPDFQASGKLRVEIARSPKTFAINRWAKKRKVTKMVGYYLTLTAQDAARVINSNPALAVWPLGNEAPANNETDLPLSFPTYDTLRYQYGFNIPYETVQQADWEIHASYARVSLQKAMTNRTVKAVAQLVAASWGSNTNNCTSLVGGKMSAGTSTTPYGLEAFLAVQLAINQSSIGVARPEDLVAVMNPNTAKGIRTSQEFIDQLKQSPDALAYLIKGENIRRGQWALPPVFNGVDLIVDDTVVVTSKENVAGTASTGPYAMADGDIYFITRTSGLTMNEADVDFSTCQFFDFEDMTVETRDEPGNRREAGRVVDNYDFQVVAPATGYRLTGCI
jgi:hypothetical protein